MRGRLGTGFWKRFAREHWEKKPVVFRWGEVVPPELMFGVLQQASAQYRQNSALVSLAVGFGHSRQVTNKAMYLPDRQDTSFAGYLRRIREEHDRSDLGLVLINPQAISAQLWRTLRELAHGLFAEVGVPVLGLESVLFCGNYRRSPEGLHKDTAGVFCLVIEGRKRMRVWPFPAFAGLGKPDGSGNSKKPLVDGFDHSGSLEGSTLLEGEPGDVLYWPSSYWHVAEADGSPVMSLSIAAHPARISVVPNVLSLVGQVLEEDLGPAGIPGLRRTAGRRPPAAVGRVLERLADPAGTWRARVEDLWLKQSTTGGLRGPHPLVPGEVQEGDRVWIDTRYPLVLRRCGDRLLVVANGRAGELPLTGAGRKLCDLAAQLRSGERLRVSAVLATAADHRETILRFFDLLLQWGVLFRLPRQRGAAVGRASSVPQPTDRPIRGAHAF
jgi:50S ribosomal protein L16 3-hydroxylase